MNKLEHSNEKKVTSTLPFWRQVSAGTAAEANFNATTNRLSLYIGSLEFQFLTDKELQDPATLTAGNFAWVGGTYDKDNLQSANSLISNTKDNSVAYINTNPFNQQLNLQPIRNVYIHSTNLGNFNTIGARGEQTIIKKVPVNKYDIKLDYILTEKDH